jgi:iron complex outermembrane receptor protein
VLASGLLAFQPPPVPDKSRYAVVVTGRWEPLPLEEADRAVRAFDVPHLRVVTNTYADLLQLDSSIDLRQRAPDGLQGDVSIRGGTFGQTLILLDGLRLNDVQSAHHNFDLPIPLDSIGAVEILKGSGSTFYGSDAVGGVVNFLTRRPEASEVRLRGALGNFGFNSGRGTIAYVRDAFTEQISFSRDFSSGFMPNRDYRNVSLASITRARTNLGTTRIVLAHRDSPFGAEQFYGNFSSWERTKTWWAAIRQDIGTRTDVSFSWRKHTDMFVLYRDRPSFSTNRHRVDSYQGAVRRHENLPGNVKLFYGGEIFRDSIVSNNLGSHDRTRGAGYVGLDVRALRRFSFQTGVRDEYWGSGNHQVSPTLSAGYWLAPVLKLRGAFSQAFRLPTYTDLYYRDPSNQGSPTLEPEKARSYEAGIDWNTGGRLEGSITLFHRRERDGIDFVRSSRTEIWRATNFQRVRFSGIEADVRLRVNRLHQLDWMYTNLRGAQDVLAGLQSKYVFNYPVHRGIFTWLGHLPAGVLLRMRVGATERFGRDPYAVWDSYAAFTKGRIRPFVQLTNLSGTRYEEIPGVAMPGRGMIGGIEIAVFGPS